MKKFILVSVFLAATAVLFSSCSTQEKCPAFGNSAPVKEHKARV